MYGEFLLKGTEKFLPNWKKKVIIGHFTGMNGIFRAWSEGRHGPAGCTEKSAERDDERLTMNDQRLPMDHILSPILPTSSAILESGKQKEGFIMSFVLAEDMDFGTVETAVYGYVNFCQGPDFYEFRMSPEAARPFMEKIEEALAGLNGVLKKLDPQAEPLEQVIYQEGNEDNQGTIVFTAYLLGPVAIDGDWMSEGDALKFIDEMDPEWKQNVTCDLVADQCDFGNIVSLQLKRLDGRE